MPLLSSSDVVVVDVGHLQANVMSCLENDWLCAEELSIDMLVEFGYAQVSIEKPSSSFLLMTSQHRKLLPSPLITFLEGRQCQAYLQHKNPRPVGIWHWCLWLLCWILSYNALFIINKQYRLICGLVLTIGLVMAGVRLWRDEQIFHERASALTCAVCLIIHNNFI